MKIDFGRVVSKGKFIAELDGLRFIAIISVLLFHANGRMLNRLQVDLPYVSDFLKTGFFGVEIFFAISGYILSLQFFKADSFSYRKYLIRRLKRIEPPFVIAIVTQTFLAAFILRSNEINELFSSFINVITYTSNFAKNNIINGVTWSLEVEVQFYLLLPFILILALKLGKKSLPWVLILLSILAINFIPWIPYKTLLMYFHYFSVGILIAHLNTHRENRLKIKLGNWFNVLITLMLFALNLPYFHFLGSFKLIISISLMIILFYNVLVARSGIGFLTPKWVTTLGGMCYTIYLWHIPVLSFASNYFLPKVQAFITNDQLLYVLGMLFMILFSLIISIPLFLLFEKPFMYRQWRLPFSIQKLKY